MSQIVKIHQGATLSEYAKQILGPNASHKEIAAMVDKIAQENNIKDKNSIFAGKTLELPDAPNVNHAKAKHSKNENIFAMTPNCKDESEGLYTPNEPVSGCSHKIEAENQYEEPTQKAVLPKSKGETFFTSAAGSSSADATECS